MGWKDAPLVEEPKSKWAQAPLVDAAIARDAPMPPDLVSGRDPQAKNYGRDPTTDRLGLVNAGTRMLAKGIGALPLMAMDLGVAGRNVAGNVGRSVLGMEPTPDYQLPSSMFNEELDKVTTPPTEFTGKVAEIAGTVFAGGGLTPKLPPMPQKPVQTAKDLSFEAARQAGYVVPPASMNPTQMNRMLEGIAGKLTLAQAASGKNVGTTNKLANRALGLVDEAPITPESISALRRQAGEAYSVLRNAGEIVTDKQFLDDLNGIAAKYTRATKEFPGLVDSDVPKLVQAAAKDRFSSDAAVDAMSVLREKASAAFASGDKSLGGAYRAISHAIESTIERSLAGRGAEFAGALDLFRKARTLIAKSYSVEDALNPATGNVSAIKLGKELGLGSPMTGELGLAGRFGMAFPKAARQMDESLPGFSPLDFYASGGVSALTQSPMWMALPFVRPTLRNALLSETGQQRLAVPGAAQPPQRSMIAALLADQDRN